jgi:hypothetical protein
MIERAAECGEILHRPAFGQFDLHLLRRQAERRAAPLIQVGGRLGCDSTFSG